VRHENGCRGRPARHRDGHHGREPVRHRIALQSPLEGRYREEDRSDGGEGELEAGLEERIRVPGEQHGGTGEEEIPAVTRTRAKPGERRECAGDPCPDDRRLPTNREQIRANGGQRADLSCPARKAERPQQQERAADDVGDVLTGDREQVVQTRGPEALLELCRETLVIAQDNSGNDGPALAGHAGRERPLERAADPVGKPAQASPPAHDAEGVRPQHDVNPLAPQIRGLIECALVRLARQPQPGGELEHGSLGRRSATRQLEAGRLVYGQSREAEDAHGDADGELAAARRPGDLDARGPRPAGLAREDTLVQMLEPQAPPPPPDR
jgi:hypothetical protein